MTILTRCHQAMKPQGKVLLVEQVLLSDRTAELLVLESDLNMLLELGGRERTEAEYRALLGAAGFELTQILPVQTPYHLLEAVRA